MGPKVPYQQCVILFGVDHMCLTSHSVGNLSHNFNRQSPFVVEGLNFTMWNTYMKRIEGSRYDSQDCLGLWEWGMLKCYING